MSLLPEPFGELLLQGLLAEIVKAEQAQAEATREATEMGRISAPAGHFNQPQGLC